MGVLTKTEKYKLTLVLEMQSQKYHKVNHLILHRSPSNPLENLINTAKTKTMLEFMVSTSFQHQLLQNTQIIGV